jgi:CBS domain-containing protein
VMRGRGANLMQLLTVGDAMQPLPASLPGDMPLNEVIARIADESTDGLPVVDAEGGYRGTIGSQQIDQAMRENALDARAADLAQDLPALRTTQSLEEALGVLLRARSGLPVVDPHTAVPTGWLTNLDVLRAYNARLQQGIDQARTRHYRSRPGQTSPVREPRRVRTALARLRGYRVVDLELALDRPPVGRRLADVAWPARSTVLAIRRDDRAFEPSGDDRLEQGDRLTVLVPAAAADALVDVITGDGDGDDDAEGGER